MGEGDGAVAADDGELQPDVDVALFHDGGQRVEDLVLIVVVAAAAAAKTLQTQAALIEDDSNAFVAVALGEELADGAGAAVPGAFLVEAKGEDEGTGGGPAGGEKCLDGGEEGGQAVLVVAGAAAPEVLSIVNGGEGRVRPGGFVGDGDDVLVRGEQCGL